MTYEDAVKILLHLNTLGALIEGENKDEERAEAISMAIQALRICHEQEPLSEEIEKKAKEYAKKECPNPDLRYFYEQAYIAGAMEMASQGWIDVCERMPEETVSEDLDKFATQSANKLYPPEYEMADDNWKQRAGYVKGCKDGAKWQKQQLMKSAVKGVVHHFGDDEIAAIHYNDPKGVPMSYFVSSNDLKAGDNVKMITIKED